MQVDRRSFTWLRLPATTLRETHARDETQHCSWRCTSRQPAGARRVRWRRGSSRRATTSRPPASAPCGFAGAARPERTAPRPGVCFCRAASCPPGAALASSRPSAPGGHAAARFHTHPRPSRRSITHTRREPSASAYLTTGYRDRRDRNAEPESASPLSAVAAFRTLIQRSLRVPAREGANARATAPPRARAQRGRHADGPNLARSTQREAATANDPGPGTTAESTSVAFTPGCRYVGVSSDGFKLRPCRDGPALCRV
jgi:hypothetical protein